jgi:hypothetical protein
MPTTDRNRTGKRSSRPGGARLPAVAAVLVAAAFYVVLPTKLLAGPRTVVPIVELALVVPLVAITSILVISRGVCILK